MNQPNPDLESALISGRNDPEPDPNPDNQPQPRPSTALTWRHEMVSDVFKMWEFSLCANIVLLFIHSGKLAASLYVILSKQYLCISTKEIWIFSMSGFDFLYLWIIALRLWHASKVKRSSTRRNSVHPRNNSGLGDFANAERVTEYRVTQSFEQETSRLYKFHFTIWFLTKLSQVVWFGLFLWGEYLYLFSSSESPCDTDAVNTLLRSFLILGCIWIFTPLILMSMLYIMFVVWFLMRRPAVAPAENAAIENLPVKEYTEDIPGNKECAICMVDYQVGDKIIQLSCNTLHHFHEECVKKWLRINGVCPVCRVRIDGNQERPL